MEFGKDEIDWILDDAQIDIIRKYNHLLRHVELKMVRGPGAPEYPPIIIIGAPRCGSTVAYQLLAEILDVGYITKFIARFWGAPSIGAFLSEKVYNLEKASKLESKFGVTRGLGGLNEFSYFWWRFFPPGDSDYVEEIDEHVSSELKKSLGALTHVFGKPVLFKILQHSWRIKPLLSTFPNCRFIVVCREPLYMAQSIFIGRRDKGKNINDWWSVIPKEIAKLRDLPPHEQIVAQIYYIYREIKKRSNQNPENFFFIDYSKFLKNPIAIGKGIHDHFNIKLREDLSIPYKQINISKRQMLDDDNFIKLKSMIEKYYGVENPKSPININSE